MAAKLIESSRTVSGRQNVILTFLFLGNHLTVVGFIYLQATSSLNTTSSVPLNQADSYQNLSAPQIDSSANQNDQDHARINQEFSQLNQQFQSLNLQYQNPSYEYASEPVSQSLDPVANSYNTNTDYQQANLYEQQAQSDYFVPAPSNDVSAGNSMNYTAPQQNMYQPQSYDDAYGASYNNAEVN